jgi:hypothetical protein
MQWAARFQLRQHGHEKIELVLVFLFVRPRLAELIAQALDAAADDVEVGNQQIVVKILQIGSRLGPAEAGHDHHERPCLANGRQLLGAAFMRAAQAGRIDNFERRLRDLLGLIDFAKLRDSRLWNGRHRALRGMRESRIGRDARQPVEEGALARSLVTDNSYFHRFCAWRTAGTS